MRAIWIELATRTKVKEAPNVFMYTILVLPASGRPRFGRLHKPCRADNAYLSRLVDNEALDLRVQAPSGYRLLHNKFLIWMKASPAKFGEHVDEKREVC